MGVGAHGFDARRTRSFSRRKASRCRASAAAGARGGFCVRARRVRVVPGEVHALAMNLRKTQPQFEQDESSGVKPRSSKRSTPTENVDVHGHKSVGPRLPSSPPPPGKVESNRVRPPRGRRTPSVNKSEGPDFGPPLPANAPGWMRRARRIVLALEKSIQDGKVSKSTEASIERAYAAYELGSSDRQIAGVAHLVERAHQAIRDTSRAELESAYVDCAEVLYQGLPAPVQRQKTFDEVVEAIRQLRKEADGWTAVISATSHLLGWDEGASAHAAHAIRIALLDNE